jgi:hypothetical protein
MPAQDKTGPLGTGPIGWGRGGCEDVRPMPALQGRRCGRGCGGGRGFGRGRTTQESK